MMLLDDLCSRLIAAAGEMEWEARVEPTLTNKSFRGRETEADVRFLENMRGLMLGRYPVLAAEISIAPQENSIADLRAAHNQMLIARSYLRKEQIIDAHILFVAEEPPSDTDWRRQVDKIERDESVCRKLVWMPDRSGISSSFDAFRDRTFLARPWTTAQPRSDAPLDQNEELVQKVLEMKGLSRDEAETWVRLAASGLDDSEALVQQLIAAMEPST